MDSLPDGVLIHTNLAAAGSEAGIGTTVLRTNTEGDICE